MPSSDHAVFISVQMYAWSFELDVWSGCDEPVGASNKNEIVFDVIRKSYLSIFYTR
jgi:hypothetical protein